MSARLFRGFAPRGNGAVRGRARALLVMGGAVGIAGVLGVVAQAVTTVAYDATAKLTPGLYYINDTAGSVYAFTVTNTGSSASIGAVEIRRPTNYWSVSGCVAVPGWTSQRDADKCRYRSATSSSDDIKPGQSKVFKIGAKTAAGNIDRVGTWKVNVSKTNHFNTPSMIRGARATGPGLTTKLFTFELMTAVVTDGPRTPGSACPAANKAAVVGAVKTIVLCGRNRANVALQPSSAYSTVSGTFIKTPGSFSSGVIQPNSGNVVLAQWNNTVISDQFGSGKKVIGKVGARSDRTSPLRTFTGYNATSSPPVAVNDAHNTAEDTALVVAAPGVLANDTDAESDPLTAVDASDPANGTVALAPDGSFTYTPDPDFHGTDSFTYKAFDSHTKSGAATVTITVAPVNDLPVGVADAQTIGEDAGDTTVSVLANDTDADNDPLSVSAVDTTGTAGTVTNHGTHVSYDPNGNFESLGGGETATDTFTYTVSDGTGSVANVVVTITIAGDNDDPVAVADTASTTEDAATAPISVLGNDSDDEGPLTITAVGATSNGGTVTNNGDGTVTFDPAGAFEGLADGQSDTSSFTYTVTDNGGETATATVTVTVTGVNDAPVGNADAQSVGEDAGDTNVLVLGNDTDAESQALDVSSVDVTGTSGTVTNHGTHVSYDPNGQFAHLGDGQTATDTFTYTVRDAQGATDAGVVVTITITGGDNQPVAMDDAYSTDEATPIGPLSILANDSDAEGALTLTSVGATSNGGTVTDNGNGTVTFDPAGAFEDLAAGQSDTTSFTYTVTDTGGNTDTATVTVTVNGINDAPVGVDDAATVGEGAADTTVLVLGNDTDAESQALDVSAIDVTGTQGTVTNHGTHVSYDPNGKFEGLGDGETATDTFTYTVRDAQGATDTGVLVTITITGDNDAPVAVDDTATTDEATATGPISVLANDSDAEGALTITSVGATSNGGTVTNNGDGTVTFDPAGAFEDLAAGQSDTSSFTYTVTDSGGETDTATVTVTVNGINDAPVGVDDVATVGEDASDTNVLVLGNDTDAESQALDVSAVDVTGTSGVVTNHGTHVSYDPDGTFEGLDDGETATDTFTYTVRDAQGATDTATVTVTVSGANDAPVAGDDGTYQTLTDTPLVVAAPGVLANDLDADGEALTAGNASDPAHGTVEQNADGSFTYTPDAGYTGADSFTYDVSDGTATDSGTVTIDVVPPNATPTVDATSASGNEDGGAIIVTLTGHDADGDALTFTAGTATNGLVTVPAGLSCDANTPSTCTATVTYTPNPNFNGTDSFTYTANDGTIDSAPATATITVNPVNDAPSFTKGADQTVLEDAGAQTVAGWATAISAGPANESGQTVSFDVTNNNNGLFSAQPAVSPTGELTYTAAPNANGVATVTVKIMDDGGTANGGVAESATQTFTITVTAVNDVPSFTKGADQTVNEDAGAQSVSNWASAISKGPADESGQTLSFTTSNDNNALFSVQPGVSPTGTLVYTSAPNKYGSATVTISLSDNGGTANGGDDTSDSQTFTITVNPVNDAPIAAAKAYTVQANMKISLGGLLTGATDPNDVAGDPAWTPTFTLGTISPGAGCIGCTISNVDNAAGTFDFDPPAGGSGTYTVTYTVVDSGFPAPGIASAPQTITFTINGPVIWFVDTAVAPGGTGRLSAPFNTLGSATTAMASNVNQRIFVRGGNVTGNVTLPADGWLISEAATGASFDSVMAITPPAGTIARPAVNGTQRTLTGTVTVGNNSVVRGFDLAPTSGNAAFVGSGKTGLVANQLSATTTNARAVDLLNSSGVFTFTRVTATGGTRGLSLSNVNMSTGSFTVTGTGTAGSGGTISGSTALGGNTVGLGEGGIYLKDTKNVTLDRMVVSGNSASGIYGNNVTTFSLANSTVSNNGTNETLDHDGIRFENLLGTSSLSSVTVFGSREDNAGIMNSTGTATLTVSNSTFRDNNASVGANGLYVDTSGNAGMTFTSTNNTFQRNHTSGLAIFGQSSVKLVANVTGGSYVTDNGVGLDIEGNGTGGMQFNVQGGTVTGCVDCASPVVVYKGTGATGTGANAFAGTVNGMTVTNANSDNAAGIWVHGEGPGAARIAITNNNVSQVAHYGINVSFGSNSTTGQTGPQTVDVLVSGNTVNPGTTLGTLDGIFVDSGLLSGDTTSMCADIKSNNVTNSIDDDIRVRNRQAGTSFRLPGYAGGATDLLAVESFLLGQNTAADADAQRNASNGGFLGGGACAAP